MTISIGDYDEDDIVDEIPCDDIDTLDVYHKSIRDQLTLVKARIHDIKNDIIKDTDNMPQFVAEMCLIGEVRGNIPFTTEHYDYPDAAFTEFVELKSLVNKLIMSGSYGNEELILKLLHGLHVPEVKVINKQVEPEGCSILLTVFGIAAVVAVAVFVYNMLTDE